VEVVDGDIGGVVVLVGLWVPGGDVGDSRAKGLSRVLTAWKSMEKLSLLAPSLRPWRLEQGRHWGTLMDGCST